MHFDAEQAKEDARLREVDMRVRKVMDIPEEESVVYVDLHDALTTLAAHGKHIPEDFDKDLLLTINQEAAKRMTALVAPQAHIEVCCPDPEEFSACTLYAVFALTWHVQMIWQIALRCWQLIEVDFGEGPLIQGLPGMHGLRH